MNPRTQNISPALSEYSGPGPAEKTRARAEGGSSKRHFYKPLPKLFQRDGFAYRRIARDGDAATYVQAWCGCPESNVCYEVVWIRRRNGFNIDGRFVEPAEFYPASEASGVDGWTMQNKESAFCKLRKLVAACARPPQAKRSGAMIVPASRNETGRQLLTRPAMEAVR
jgi:hypothetical protein